VTKALLLYADDTGSCQESWLSLLLKIYKLIVGKYTNEYTNEYFRPILEMVKLESIHTQLLKSYCFFGTREFNENDMTQF
jgi:hypothetical protein